jgi:hypothetical protein
MNDATSKKRLRKRRELTCEMLILPDGQVLAHGLTSTFAALLRGMNPREPHWTRRARPAARRPIRTEEYTP